MATKRKRNGKWVYCVKRAGLLDRPLNLTFADDKEGDEYVARLEALLDRGIVPTELMPERASPRLRDHARKYQAAQHQSDSDADYLRVALARLPAVLELRELTFTWATAWVTRMKREDNLSPGTIRHHVGALARCLDWLAAHGNVPFNPLRSLSRAYATYTPDDAEAVRAEGMLPKDDDQRDRRLRDGEEDAIRRILAGEKPKDRQRALELPNCNSLILLFELALETAMRMAEMYTLDFSQVDLKRRTIFLDKTKNGSKRQVPLSSVAVKLLRAYLRDMEGGRVFPWWNGDDAERERVTARLSRQFARIASAAGCDDLKFHDLRHEATSRLFERTELSDVEIAKITGHSSTRMLMRYANLRGSTLATKLW